jgi:glycosyltransferase involved in cell wall biosynthesis
MANRNLHFLLVGGGPLDRAVDRELARRPLHNLTRLPFRHDTDELFEAVDLCLLVSEYEGLPVFLLEGMARGIPCVATAVGDIPYLLQEGGGVAAGPPGDLAALERALESLLDDRRRADGQRARARWSRTSASTAVRGRGRPLPDAAARLSWLKASRWPE